MALIEMNRGDGGIVLVEVEGPGLKTGVGKAAGVAEGVAAVVRKIDTGLDRLLIREIVENCRMLDSAFRELSKANMAVIEATAEFGLKENGEGNVYVVKTSVEAAFTVAVKWRLEA